jgi:hypothetical protein
MVRRSSPLNLVVKPGSKNSLFIGNELRITQGEQREVAARSTAYSRARFRGFRPFQNRDREGASRTGSQPLTDVRGSEDFDRC